MYDIKEGEKVIVVWETLPDQDDMKNFVQILKVSNLYFFTSID